MAANLKIPEYVKNYNEETQKEIFEYLNQLDQFEKKAYEIAFEHLASSFNILRSNGFKEWKNKKGKA
jgi:hypothetical protein